MVEAEDASAEVRGHDGLALDAVIDAIPVGVVVTNASGQQLVNREMRTLQRDYQRSALLDAAVRRAGEPNGHVGNYRETLDFAGASGASYVISARPLPDGGTVTLVEDVSDRRRIEAVRRDFVANVGHELRTPIGAIAILAESLVGETNAETSATIRTHIAQEAERAAVLIDELLDLSRLETAKVANFETLSLSTLIEATLDIARPLAVGAKVRLTRDTPKDGFIRGIHDEMLSALTNLVTNAIKYSSRDSEVILRARDDGGFWLIDVVDFGIGIPAKEQGRIFERFYRVDPSRDRSTGGTGIGLSMVRHIAANHDGWVSVSSREGEGSTFTFAVPQAEGQ